MVFADEVVNQTITISARVVENSGNIGGGEGGSIIKIPTSVNFSGWAYPLATVYVLKDGKLIKTTIAKTDGSFYVGIDERDSTKSLYTVYAIDEIGQQSLLLNFPVVVNKGYYTEISGIRFAPTISSDKIEVEKNGYITISGYALPSKDIEIKIQKTKEQIFTGQVDNNGTYKFIYSLNGFPKGEYDVMARYVDDIRNSKLLKFIIGENNIYTNESLNNIPGDCNADHAINIVDFSVLAFWYNKLNPPSCVDINNDKVINLTDFSILAFYWTH